MRIINRSLGSFEDVLVLIKELIEPLTLLTLDEINYVYTKTPTGVTVEAKEDNEHAISTTQDLTYTQQDLSVYEGYVKLTTLETVDLTAIEADLREWLNLGDEVIIEADGEKIGYNGVAYFFKLRSADTWRYKGTCRVAYIKLPFDLSLMKSGEYFVTVPQLRDLLREQQTLPNFIQGLTKDWEDKIDNDVLNNLECEDRISLTTGKVVSSRLGSLGFPVRLIKP